MKWSAQRVTEPEGLLRLLHAGSPSAGKKSY